MRACCPTVLRAEDLDRRSVVAFKEPEQLSGNGPLQAPADVAAALALRTTPDGVGTGGGVIAEPGHHDGVERPVELPVASGSADTW